MKKYNKYTRSPFIRVFSFLLLIILLVGNITTFADNNNNPETESPSMGDSSGTDDNSLDDSNLLDESIDDSIPFNNDSIKTLPAGFSLMSKTSPGLTAGDVDVRIHSSQQDYAPYTEILSNTPPQQLTVSFTLDINRTGSGDENIVLIEFDSAIGYKGTSYFKYSGHTGIDSSGPVFGDPIYEEKDGKEYLILPLKDNILNTIPTINITYDFIKDSDGNYEYDGGVPDKTKMATINYKVISNTHTVKSGSPFIISSAAKAQRETGNIENSMPALVTTKANPELYKADLVSNSYISLSDQRIRNKFYYRSWFSPDDPPMFNVYLPVGSKIETTSLPNTYYNKGTDNNGVFIADGSVQGIPEGNYYILETKLNPDVYNKDPNIGAVWTTNIGGSLERCERIFYLDFRMPDASVDSTQSIYYSFEYTSLGSVEREYETKEFRYTIIDSKGWNFQTSVSHGPGVSGVNKDPISSILPGSQIGAPIRASGYGYTHKSSQKNSGFENVENTMFSLYQKPQKSSPDYIRANFTNMSLRVSRESRDYEWCNYKYYFEFENELTGETRDTKNNYRYIYPEQKASATAKSTEIYMTGFKYSDLKPNEYLKAVHIIPIGTTAAPKDGNYAPKNSFHLAYWIGAWPNGTYPGGESVNLDEVSLVTGWEMTYWNKNNNRSETFYGHDITTKYVGDLVAPTGQFLSYDTQINAKEPGDPIAYTFTGYNFAKAKSPWNNPTVTMRLPSGAKIDENIAIVATDSSGNSINISAVPIGEITNDGYNLYKFSGMDDFIIQPNSSFSIDFTILTPAYMPVGKYELDAILSSDSDSFVLSQRDGNRLPSGLTAADYGVENADDLFVHFLASESIDQKKNQAFSIRRSGGMGSISKIYSPITPEGSDSKLVAATFGESVKMELTLHNTSNIKYDNFVLFDILPYEGYLGSTGTISIDRIELTTPQGQASGKIYYYHGTEKFSDLESVSLPIENVSTSPDWTTELNGATAFYLDFRENDVTLNSGESLSVNIHFRIPPEDEAKNDQEVYNRYSYTMNEQGDTSKSSTYFSNAQGFSTRSFYIEYSTNPWLTDTISNMPLPQSGVFLHKDQDYIEITNQKPTRKYYLATGWTDDENGTKVLEKYNPGEKIFFNKDNPELKLYPVWEPSAPEISVPENILFGNVEINENLEIPWQSVSGKSNTDVKIVAGNYNDSDYEITLKATELYETLNGTPVSGGQKIFNALHYIPSEEKGLLRLSETAVSVYKLPAQCGELEFPWIEGNKKYGIYFKQPTSNLVKGKYSSTLTWAIQSVPNPQG